jgi:hypothetical protein
LHHSRMLLSHLGTLSVGKTKWSDSFNREQSTIQMFDLKW